MRALGKLLSLPGFITPYGCNTFNVSLSALRAGPAVLTTDAQHLAEHLAPRGPQYRTKGLKADQ